MRKLKFIVLNYFREQMLIYLVFILIYRNFDHDYFRKNIVMGFILFNLQFG